MKLLAFVEHPKDNMGNLASAAADLALLDNPIFNSLVTAHARFAEGSALARRYRPEIGPLSGVREPSAETFAELATLVPEGDLAVLFLDRREDFPAGWEVVREGTLMQMICTAVPNELGLAEPIQPLGPADFAEMVALAKLTEPGPFRDGTPELGGFVGIRVGGRLAAMAGQRLSPSGFAEVSAVCTHPDFRGRGFARALVAAVARNIFAAGLTPFLTSFEANLGAIRVYEQVGFRIRRRFELAVLKPPATK